jgi:predicted TIM-barrel fold metal-dependent hydrolase
MTGTDALAVDAHAHLLTAEALASRAPWAQPAGGPVSLDDQLREMDAAGVERALLIAPKVGRVGLPGSWRLDPAVVAAAVAAHPDRFSGIVGVDPFDGMTGVRELEEYVSEHGFVGAQVYPHWFGRGPGDASYYPFYAKCRQLGVPIQVHVGTPTLRVPEQRLRTVSRPNSLDQVACDLPDLELVATHGAWPHPAELVALADKHHNVSVLLSREPLLGWGPDIRRFCRSWGKAKVLLGADAPRRPYGDLPALAGLLTAGATDEVRGLVLGGNARRLYG